MFFTAVTLGAKFLYDNQKCSLEFISGFERLEREVIENCPSLKEGAYYPTLYLPSTACQLIAGCLQRGPPQQDFRYEKHEVISEHDGQIIQL